MRREGARMTVLTTTAITVLCHTICRLLFMDTVTGFWEGPPPIKYAYYAVMVGAFVFLANRIYTAQFADDPMSGGSVQSQIIIMSVGLMAVILSGFMAIETAAALSYENITLGSKISQIVGTPLSLAGGISLIYAGYDYTNLSTRNKKACFSLLGAAMQTYMLLYRFPKMMEVSVAPPQTIELLYLMSAALFMLFWSRTLSGSATHKQNRLTYLTGGATASLGFALVLGEVGLRILLADVLPIDNRPWLDLMVIVSVSTMALNFTTTEPRRPKNSKAGEVVV